MNVDFFNQLSEKSQTAIEKFAQTLTNAEMANEYGKFGIEVCMHRGSVAKYRYSQELIALPEENRLQDKGKINEKRIC